MERLRQEIALLEMRTEQLRIHLRSVPIGHSEARAVRAVLCAMQIKISALRRFARTPRHGKPTLH